MITEKIYNKHVFIKRKNDKKAYCSKCGHSILQDSYNMKKHAAECGFSDYDLPEIYREDQNYAFAFVRLPGKLKYYVFTPELILQKGFRDRFEGGRWKKVYCCTFSTTEKKITEEGMGNLDFWKEQKLECLNKASIKEIMQDSFLIPEYKDFSMFVEIYRGKGYCPDRMISDAQAKEFLAEDFPAMKQLTEKKHTLVRRNRDGFVIGTVFKFQNTEDMVLRVDVKLWDSNRKIRFLVGRDYFYSESRFSLEALLQLDLYCSFSSEMVKLIDDNDPTLRLAAYLEAGGKNVLIPLLCANYDSGLELLTKAGCIDLADHYYTNAVLLNKAKKKAANIVERYGIPAKVLRRVKNLGLNTSTDLEEMALIYANDPEYLRVESISHDMTLFYHYNVVAEIKGRRPDIRLFERLDRKTKLRIARYLGETGVDYRTYRDYMNMSETNQNYCSGYTPELLFWAHEVTLHRYEARLNVRKIEAFKQSVQKEEYAGLASQYGDEAEVFEKDKYMIRVPEQPDDLINESAALHHCVRMYIDRVIDGSSKILFLRKKEQPEIPFATIEVQGREVVQLKASCNKQAPRDAIQFVKKWAAAKNVRTNTRDMVC